MTLKFFLSATLLIAGGALCAQHAPVSAFDWAEKPDLPAKVLGMTDIDVVIERNLMVDRVEEGEDIVEYYLMHMREFLRDGTAIEQNNKVYVNLGNVMEVTKVKARSMDPKGKVIELGKDAFKEAEDEEDKQRYLYFAFEGLEPGCVIEYFYILKKRPDLRGDREMLQFGVPILKQRVDIMNPARLVVAAKCYNGAPALLRDTSDTDLQRQYVEMADIPALDKEDNASPLAHRMYVLYKLDRVPDRGIKDYSSYVNATKIYHSTLYPELDKKLQKDMQALVKKMDLGFARDEADRIRSAEHYLKTNFQVVDAGVKELSDLAFILKNKVCNEVGFNKLFCTVYRAAGIEHQVVVTSDRKKLPFDKDFEAFNFLQEVFLYFPSVGKYMAPTFNSLRLGYIPAEYAANHGLFIRNYDAGGVFTGVGSVKFIEPLADTENIHDIIAQVDLSDPTKARILFENKLSGFYAQFVQVYYEQLNAEQKDELLDDLVGFVTDNSQVDKQEVLDTGGKLLGVKPVTIKLDLTTRKFTGSAGEKLLFKVGELIGPQMEMYAEKPRRLPVDDSYNRRFNRQITITLPADWTVHNLDQLNKEAYVEQDGKRVMLFKSTYKLDGNTLTITIEEYYRVVKLPVEQFENYRRVVNAAADFNKVALVLEKS
ncbi:MAG: DUF3857 domain-containing protein [Flavobacteriales bacterium]|nr:DUF3857 domain-containing protein [Flavobacteriales bacterium]